MGCKLCISVSRFLTDFSVCASSEHANHVTLSVIKMLRRVVSGPQAHKLRTSLTGSDILLAIEEVGNDDSTAEDEKAKEEKEDYSYGITAVVFAALIHDADKVIISSLASFMP